MKNIKALFSLLLLGGILLSGTSCKKEYTQVVNQVYSVTYTINPNQWSLSAGNPSIGVFPSFNISLNVPEIDDIVVANGGVQVYLSLDGKGTSWDAIPEDYQGISYNANHSLGQVYIEGHYTSGGAITAPTGTILAKVVILDGQPLQ